MNFANFGRTRFVARNTTNNHPCTLFSSVVLEDPCTPFSSMVGLKTSGLGDILKVWDTAFSNKLRILRSKKKTFVTTHSNKLSQNSLKSFNSLKLKVQNSIDSILELSHTILPKHLQNCFAFCCMFPQDHKFDKDDLV
ncbi:hypothetical protein IEQ34_004239 [Dendrobium chrysotoxum]|uniref:Uncharacterized protein n=1 Tax=Dendrobium chrysotoxum TaxID=161865 RepID=A0AAV7HEI9_DENCH|nr:hypothetical protein IEQ34_004239 [Dendrobium chrysotoxum]